MKQSDSKYISKCFQLAEKGRGSVSPNPVVGAVLVKNGKIIGEGYHKKYGSSHAEVIAIKNAGKYTAGSTLYCNLEPCCHTIKQTPPCVPLIIQKKIKRVVLSNIDPNNEVHGKGIKQLRDAGIEVLTGILEDEGKELNKFYFKHISEKIPYITLKIAQSIDGKISLFKKKQTWLTGEASIKYVHKIRSEYDAVLVGAGTIKTDDPCLTVREVKGRNPIRVVIDGKLNIPIKSKILNTVDADNTWIITSEQAVEKKIKKLSQLGAKIFKVKSSKQNELELKKILKILADNKISSLLVEGGSQIFNQFIGEGLFDEIIILQAPKILGQAVGYSYHKKMKILKLKSMSKSGEDIRLIYRKKLSD